MNFGLFLVFFTAFFLVFFIIQRTEPRRRLFVATLMMVVLVLAQRFANYRGYHTEAQVGFGAAVFINLMFWVIIGRYNPVGSSDDITVLGMDD